VFRLILQNLTPNLSVAWIGTSGKSFKPGIEEVRCWKSENINTVKLVLRDPSRDFRKKVTYDR
jgi:hypothetical protein